MRKKEISSSLAGLASGAMQRASNAWALNVSVRLHGRMVRRAAGRQRREKQSECLQTGRRVVVEFHFAGQEIRESSKSMSKTVAVAAERSRRRELETSWNQIRPRKLTPLFSTASSDWLKTRTGIAPATEKSYRLAISQLTKNFGRQLLSDISGEDTGISTRRKREQVSNRTVNLELGVLRAILRRYRMWEPISQDIDFLKEAPSPGRALTAEEETRLLGAASKSRCRSLYPVILLAVNTGMRSSELRFLTWEKVDFLAKALVVGKTKTAAGAGRVIPLNLVQSQCFLTGGVCS